MGKLLEYQRGLSSLLFSLALIGSVVQGSCGNEGMIALP